MTDALKRMIDAARRVTMSASDKEEQRRSFAYGNTAIENSRITRRMVEEEADALKNKA